MSDDGVAAAVRRKLVSWPDGEAWRTLKCQGLRNGIGQYSETEHEGIQCYDSDDPARPNVVLERIRRDVGVLDDEAHRLPEVARRAA
jgi:hypothetical protein